MRNVGVYYYEKQREKWWAWVVMIVVNLLFITGCVIQIGFGRPFGDNPMSDAGIIITTSALLIISSFVLSGNLLIYINNEGVFVRYSPYHFKYKFYGWENIRQIYVREYHPLREYGGRGIRVARWKITGKTLHLNRSVAYSISGRSGLQIILKNGKMILIGIQQPDELIKVLKKLGKIT